MNYTIKLTTKKNGSILHQCFDQDGNLVGKRVSQSRVYPFCLVTRLSKPAAIKKAKRQIESFQKTAVEYQAVADAAKVSEQDGVEVYLSQGNKLSTFSRQFIREGRFQEWADSNRESEKKAKERLSLLSSGSQDADFQKPFVQSWHSRLDLVKAPDGSDIQVGIGQVAAAEKI